MHVPLEMSAFWVRFIMYVAIAHVLVGFLYLIYKMSSKKKENDHE